MKNPLPVLLLLCLCYTKTAQVQGLSTLPPGDTSFANHSPTGSFITLPIVLLDFRTNKTLDGRSRLQWTLAQIDESFQINLLHSTDNQSWKTVMTLYEPMNGPLRTYEFVPPTCQDINFYQLQIITNGFDTVDSKVIPLECNATIPLAYPNPSRDYLTVALENKNWTIYSMDGHTWKTPATIVSTGLYQLDLRSLLPGYYILKCGEKKIPFLHL